MVSFIFVLIAVGLAVFYAYIMRRYWVGWTKLPEWKRPPAQWNPRTRVSVLVPARNEADNIERCVRSILDQPYPPNLLEVMVIDDHSTDATPDIVRRIAHPSVRLVQLADFIQPNETQSFKKKAIEIGVGQASGDLILTTDGDCIVPSDWLRLMVSFYEANGSEFIAAPVNFYGEKSDFERFQSLDFLGMMVITGGGIQSGLMNMCNGANLGYEKSAFYAVGGFEGINKKASGDDMLLMQKIVARNPKAVGYLKSPYAAVLTQAKPTLRGFFNQRVRWTTKAGDYRERRVTMILGLVWLFCVSIVASGLVAVFMPSAVWLGLWSIKIITDFFFLRTAARYFGRTDLMRSFLTASLWHLAYIVAVGFWGNVAKKYEWKGRQVR